MSLSLSGGGGGGGVVYHTSTGQYIGVGTFFFLFFSFEPGLKLDEKSIENGLEGQKFLVVCLFWGGCHHPNSEMQDGNFLEHGSVTSHQLLEFLE